jgi:hypothetical protein
MSTTTIKSLTNTNFAASYLVKNHDNPDSTGGLGKALELSPGQTLACNISIPACTSQQDFDAKKRISIAATTNSGVPVTLSIWQDGDHVRYSKDGLFHSGGDLVPGNNAVNGDRELEITGFILASSDVRFD